MMMMMMVRLKLERISHDEFGCNYRRRCCDGPAGAFLKRRPRTQTAAAHASPSLPPLPPPLPLSLSVCLRVSRPLSPGEAAPNQRCDLFIRRLQTRPRRRHERPRLVLANCLICLSGDPAAASPPRYPSATSLTPSPSHPPPLRHQRSLFVSN